MGLSDYLSYRNIAEAAKAGWNDTLGAHPLLPWAWLITAIVILVVSFVISGKKSPGIAFVFFLIGSLMAFVTWWQVYVTLVNGHVIIHIILLVFILGMGYLAFSGEAAPNGNGIVNWTLLVVAAWVYFIVTAWVWAYPAEWAWLEVW